jgi:hypothetical protein
MTTVLKISELIQLIRTICNQVTDLGQIQLRWYPDVHVQAEKSHK